MVSFGGWKCSLLVLEGQQQACFVVGFFPLWHLSPVHSFLAVYQWSEFTLAPSFEVGLFLLSSSPACPISLSSIPQSPWSRAAIISKTENLINQENESKKNQQHIFQFSSHLVNFSPLGKWLDVIHTVNYMVWIGQWPHCLIR